MAKQIENKTLAFLVRAWQGHVAPRLAFYASFFRNPNQTLVQWPETGARLGPKVAVFVHFDRSGAVRQHVLDYIGMLQENGFDVAFVTNAGRLLPAAMTALQSLCRAIIIRRNVGYDFGAMREGVFRLGLPRPETEQVLIVNDSVYGPLRPLDEMLGRIDFDEADVWGCTESWQARYHLQSYFLAFGPAALRSPAWLAFWKNVRPVASKPWIIFRYEVGLSQRMIRAGLRCRALWPYPELVRQVDPMLLSVGGEEGVQSTDPIVEMRKLHARRIRDAAVSRKPLNPTNDLWRQLLMAGFPFIKRELLRDNPTDVRDVVDWREVVEHMVGADPGPIERDLQRMMKNVAP